MKPYQRQTEISVCHPTNSLPFILSSETKALLSTISENRILTTLPTIIANGWGLPSHPVLPVCLTAPVLITTRFMINAAMPLTFTLRQAVLHRVPSVLTSAAANIAVTVTLRSILLPPVTHPELKVRPAPTTTAPDMLLASAPRTTTARGDAKNIIRLPAPPSAKHPIPITATREKTLRCRKTAIAPSIMMTVPQNARAGFANPAIPIFQTAPG